MVQIVNFQVTQKLLLSIAVLILLFSLRLASFTKTDQFITENHKNGGSESKFLNSNTSDILDHTILLLWGLLCALQDAQHIPGSTHYMPVALSPSPSCDSQRCLQALPNILCRGQSGTGHFEIHGLRHMSVYLEICCFPHKFLPQRKSPTRACICSCIASGLIQTSCL